MKPQLIRTEAKGDGYAQARHAAVQRESRWPDGGDLAINDRIARLESVSAQTSTMVAQLIDQLRGSEERLTSLLRPAAPPTADVTVVPDSIPEGRRAGQAVGAAPKEFARSAEHAKPSLDYSVLDWLQCAVALFDRDFRLLRINRNGKQALSCSSCLYARDDGLHCQVAASRTRFLRLLKEASAGRWGSMVIQAEWEPATHLLAIPLRSANWVSGGEAVRRHDAPRSRRHDDAWFAVCFRTPKGVASGTLEAFASLHELTAAERRVLAMLTEQRTPSEIAAGLGPPSSETVQHGLPDKIAANTPYGIYFFRSMTHSQCESPRTIFLVSLNVKFGFTLAATPSPQF